MHRFFVTTALLLVVVPLAAQDGWRDRHHHHRGLHLRIARDYYLPEGSSVTQPIVVIGGSATIDGRAEDDVVVVGGALRVGPHAAVEGDIVSIGGEITVDPAARVDGDVQQGAIVWPDIGSWWPRTRTGWSVALLWAAVTRLALVLMVTVILTLVAPRWIGAMSARAARSTGSSALIGLVGEVLFMPALICIAVALLISIIGIPLLALLPFLIGGFALFWVAGFAAAAAWIGSRLSGRSGDGREARLSDVLIGFAILTGLTLIGHLLALGPFVSPFAGAIRTAGLVVEYVAWTIGLGAAIGTFLRLGTTGRVLPPPMPSTP